MYALNILEVKMNLLLLIFESFKIVWMLCIQPYAKYENIHLFLFQLAA